MCRALVFAVFISMAGYTHAQNFTQNPHVSIEAIIARQESIRNIYTEYIIDETFTPIRRPEINKNPDKKTRFIEGSFSWSCKFQFVYGKSRFEKEILKSPASVIEGDLKYEIRAYSGDRFELAYSPNNENRTRGVIQNTEPLPTDAVIDLSLGLRSKGMGKWITQAEWQQFVIKTEQDGMLTLEQKSDHPTYSDRRVDRWTFNPNNGFALVRYAVLWKPEPGAEFALDTEVVNSDFADFSGITLPRHVSYKTYHNKRDEQPVVIQSKELTINDYRVNEVNRNNDDFMIVWPSGSIVWDARCQQQFTVEKGPMKITDDFIRDYIPGRSLGGIDGKSSFSLKNQWFLIINFSIICVFGLWVLTRKR